MRLIRRILYLFQQRRNAAELAEEIEFHRQMAEQETGGRHEADRRMGATLIAQEAARGVWVAAWLESVLQDLRYGIRSLAAAPGFTMLAVVALSLGIGLNTSLFTAFNAFALRPWPVRDPQRVVNLLSVDPAGHGYGGFSMAEYRYLQAHSQTLDGVIFLRNERVNLDHQSDGSKSMAYLVSGNYFTVLGSRWPWGAASPKTRIAWKLPHRWRC
jgi:macrolide transport system ATP-binding/permease protein